MKSLKSVMSVTLRSRFIIFEVVRRIMQFFFLIFLNSAIFGLSAIPLVLPILLPSGLPYRIAGEALSAIQKMIYDSVFPLLPLASIILFSVLTGRALCGWVCPMGLIQDILAAGETRKFVISPKTHKSLIGLKYFILGLILLISVSLSLAQLSVAGRVYREMLGLFAQAPFNVLSPSDTLFAALPRLLSAILISISLGFEYLTITPLLIIRLVILIAILFLAVRIPRAWCRYVCPQGAFSALISRFSLLGLRRDIVRCRKVGCRMCEEKCPMNVPILKLSAEKITDPECIYCLRCIAACPVKAIKPKFP
ncbi:4Fe-4S binding protein [Candidatus Bathyarchaeota archaeon]|nr:4Fe-4S binding protein [Candidatus Bathyarchaeota archaeon]